MKKALLSFSFSVIISLQISAQWNSVNAGTTQDLYSVDYYSTNDIWVGSFNQIVKTSDGTNWTINNPIKDPSNVSIQPANIYDIALTSSTSAIATGLFFTGNTETILNTTNSGANWTLTYTNNSVPLLRYINSVDIFGSNAIGVGNTGRIARSTNSGASWSFITSGTTSLINDVKYATADTIFAVGENVILRSVDGGLSWTKIIQSGSFTTVTCDRNVIFVGNQNGNTLLRSNDYGNTYSSISLPFNYSGVIYALNSTTIFAAGTDGVYVSKTSGQYWEKYILSGYQQVKMFDFYDPSNGIAVGNAGYVIKTSNISASPTAPITSFTIQGGAVTFCLGDSLILNNTTAPLAGYTYQWKLNGSQFSTSYNTGIRLNNGGTQTISLTVNNGSNSSTFSIPVTVIDHYINPVVFTTTADTVCGGNYVGFNLSASQTGVTYQLRKGYTNIGTAQNGTGGALTFSSLSGVTSTSSFNIKAKKTTSCFTDSLVQNKTIYVYTTASPIATACTPADNLCGSPGYDPGITNVTFGTINNTSTYLLNNYFDYSCCKNMNVTMGNSYSISVTTAYVWGEYVKVWIDANNDGVFNTSTEQVFSGFANHTVSGLITIPTTTLFNQKVRMRVGSDYDSNSLNTACALTCGEMEDYSVTILPAPSSPTAGFTKVVTNGCTTSVVFSNTSYNAVSYSWNFGDGSPITSAVNPSHIYSNPGTYTITLTATNPYGSNTSTQSLTITVPQIPIPSVCDPALVGCTNPPLITRVQQDGFPFLDVAGPNNDFTCTGQFHLIKDSTYLFFVTNNGVWNQFTPYLDANNDGIFSFPDESLFPNGQNQGAVGTTAINSFVYFDIPNTAPENVPLRMRLAMSDHVINRICDVTCGDYKDFTVFLNPHPLTTLFSVGVTTLCTPDSAAVNFVNRSRGANSWLWDFGDGSFSTLKSPTHVYNSFGTFTVKLKSFMGTQVDSLVRTNYITIKPALPVPVLTLTGTVLSTTTVANGYQWYKDNVIISGANSSSYNFTQNGSYKLVVTTANGCSTSSATATFPVTANFGFSSTSGCAPAQIYFYDGSSGASSYTINWGDGSTESWLPGFNPFHTYIAGTYSVKLKVWNSVGICDSITRTNFITISSFPAVPVITEAGNQLSTSNTATYYQWYLDGNAIGGATSFVYTALQVGNYTVRVTNSAFCGRFSAAHYYPSGGVWPGDANNDSSVNNYDLLPIGLYYSQTGFSRSSVSNNWTSFPCQDWSVNQVTGSDLKHVDCNGDGLIDDNDTLAVNLNFSSVHALAVQNTNDRSTDPDLYFTTSNNTYLPGDFVNVDILAGTAGNPAIDLYGLAFNINYDASLVQPATESLNYPNSWLGTPNIDVIKFSRIDAATNTAFGAETRIDDINRNGYGKIATFRFQISPSISTLTTMNFGFSSFSANDSVGNDIPLNNVDYSIVIDPSATGVSENSNNNSIAIYPNPYSEYTTISYTLSNRSDVEIEVYNSIGQKIKTVVNSNEPSGDHKYQFSAKEEGYNAGIYFVKITIDGKITMKRIVEMK